MAFIFPSEDWLNEFTGVLNSDAKYAQVAKDWEGDFLFVVEPDKGTEAKRTMLYMDLWHGKCRRSSVHTEGDAQTPKAKFSLLGVRSEFVKVLRGELDPMQAMLTRKLRVEGNMGYILRNVPTVLQFVRCASAVATES